MAVKKTRPAQGEKKWLNTAPRKCCPTLVKTPDDSSSQAPPQRRGALEVRAADSASEWRQAKAAPGRKHGLGAGREAGDRLSQLVKQDGKLVAVLVWCAAAWHLKARELPAACQGAEDDGGGARSPLKVSQLQSLCDAIGPVPIRAAPRVAATRWPPCSG